MKRLIKSIVRYLLGPCAIYYIYESPIQQQPQPVPDNIILAPILEVNELNKSLGASFQAFAGYGGDGSFGFGAWVDRELASACWFWTRERYNMSRGFWPLKQSEAKLVQITTAERFRGRGIASQLIVYATHKMQQKGHLHLYARIWHTNQPSIAAFQKAGWNYKTLVIEVFPLSRKSPCRFVFNKKVH